MAIIVLLVCQKYKKTDGVSTVAAPSHTSSTDVHGHPGCIHYLHSHWLCSTKGNSMSSCFIKDVLISWTPVRKWQITAMISQFVQRQMQSTQWHRYLHGECVRECWHTLQGLVRTAATTSPHRHAGGDKEMVGLLWQLPPHLHQGVPRFTSTPWIHLQPPPHWQMNKTRDV